MISISKFIRVQFLVLERTIIPEPIYCFPHTSQKVWPNSSLDVMDSSKRMCINKKSVALTCGISAKQFFQGVLEFFSVLSEQKFIKDSVYTFCITVMNLDNIIIFVFKENDYHRMFDRLDSNEIIILPLR